MGFEAHVVAGKHDASATQPVAGASRKRHDEPRSDATARVGNIDRTRAASERRETKLNLRNFDLNLLVIFEAIVARGSVVGAADQLGLSPSAVSHALARLRVMFNDELFRRTPKGLEPTSRAVDLCAQVAVGLGHIASAVEQQHRFDPATAHRRFTLQVADYVSGLVLPRVAERLRASAPNVSVDVLPFALGPDTLPDAADLQIRFTLGDLRPSAARTRRLLTDRFVILMRPDHHAVNEAMTVERYAGLDHLRLSPAAIGTTMIDDALGRRGLQRRIVMTVPSWFDMPEIIEKTDLVAIVPSRWTRADPRLARLHAVELPLEEVGFAIDLCWDVRRERDPGQAWFRGLVTEIFEAAARQ